MKIEAGFLVALIASSALAAPGADEHVLAGARHFRAGRLQEALVEFRVAEKVGHSDEAAWYAAACLARLKRSGDAVEAFAEAKRRAPKVRDEVLDYYNAVACSDAHLFVCADTLLAGVDDRAGPRIRDQARTLRTSIEALQRAEPSHGTIDWYHLRAAEAAKRGQAHLAKAYLGEAAALSARRKDRYRLDDTPAPAAPPPRRDQARRERK
ncbi:MAG: hypothetical protein NVSMB23_16060 [Myxococcales bacterium]